MYQYIEKLNLDLHAKVPQIYIELIFNVMIQLTTGLDFAHNNGLVHGNLDLNRVAVHHTKAGEFEFKISDF